jgi:hypothetical protein
MTNLRPANVTLRSVGSERGAEEGQGFTFSKPDSFAPHAVTFRWRRRSLQMGDVRKFYLHTLSLSESFEVGGGDRPLGKKREEKERKREGKKERSVK